MKPRVYLETTIPSYLTAWPSRDLVRAAHQQITREWWDQRRTQFEVFLEVRKVREAYAQRFGYDLQAIHCDLKEQEQASGRRVVSLPPRRPKPVTAKGDHARSSKVSGRTNG